MRWRLGVGVPGDFGAFGLLNGRGLRVPMAMASRDSVFARDPTGPGPVPIPKANVYPDMTVNSPFEEPLPDH
ncbi:hypothetical protein P8C59_003817 [Phyllachora maydis]|uniref:Uncharacterized protein n=1 Tax=Phyllachora maydis TaxID=1825666 RepID=A0AAD9I271_9PEZI|nr:hypothetical protein P8C59_003817 [Phyllachora maydis]